MSLFIKECKLFLVCHKRLSWLGFGLEHLVCLYMKNISEVSKSAFETYVRTGNNIGAFGNNYLQIKRVCNKKNISLSY